MLPSSHGATHDASAQVPPADVSPPLEVSLVAATITTLSLPVLLLPTVVSELFPKHWGTSGPPACPTALHVWWPPMATWPPGGTLLLHRSMAKAWSLPCVRCERNVFILRQEGLHLKIKKAKFLLV